MIAFSGHRWQGPRVQKTTPFLMVLALGIASLYISIRSEADIPPADAAPPAVAPAPPAAVAAQPAQVVETAAKPEPVAPPVRPWPHQGSDIAPDSAATFGALPNGLRYIIQPNSEPPGRVSMRLHIGFGSLMEADDQQGLAHFLEHMAFNGTDSHKADELVPVMQRLGIAFGAGVNAYTGFDETVYMLDLPDLSKETMDLCFNIMREFGGGALLLPEEIKKERGVILNEKAARDSVDYRLMVKQFQTLLPASRIPHRLPIGTEEVIKGAPRERFADLYDRYYVPSRMTFVLVGDIDPQEMAARIEREFGGLENPSATAPEADRGRFEAPEGLVVSVFADKEVKNTTLALTAVKPFVRKPDTAAKRVADMPLEVANSMLSRRIDRLAKREGAPILGGGADRDEMFAFAELGSVQLMVADDKWREAVPLLEQEFRRVIEHGFTDDELAEARANLLDSYEQAVKRKDTRKSPDLAMGLVRTINGETVWSTPETNLEIARAGLGDLTASRCHEAFKAFWDVPGRHLILTTRDETKDLERELSALFNNSMGEPVEPPAATETAEFAYESFGKPGTVASRGKVDDMAITQLVLSNQVRINLKPTDFDKNRISLSARIGSGQLGQPKNTPMLHFFATSIVEGGGLGKHSNDELERILAGKQVGVNFAVDEDAFVLAGHTTPRDLALQLRLMCASLTDPGYRDEALWQFQKAIPMIFQQLKHSPAGPQAEMEGWLHGGDHRYSLATLEQLSAYTIADVKKWLTPELTKGYLELSIVGDFEVDAILPELLATFGALPARDKAKPDLPAARKVLFPNAPANKTLTYESAVPQAVASVFWQTPGPRGNQKQFRRLGLLGAVFADRLRQVIREELGATYSPQGGIEGSEALDHFGYMSAQAIGKTEDVDALLKAMLGVGDKLSAGDITADELERVRNPLLKSIEKMQRDNGYWLGTVLSRCQEDPQRIELIRGREADLRSITTKELNDLARKYLGAEHALLVAIKTAAGQPTE
ncbi:MAG: insulinase family protein [Akkermansiaceae bacterium]|nr:insulinase family protein [Akkermansiaceae bacterium]